MKKNPSNIKLLKQAKSQMKSRGPVRIDWTLKFLQIYLPITSTLSTSTENVSPQSELLLNGATAIWHVEIRAKLSRLEMKRFNGRQTEWQAFIDCFDSAVHSNPKLSNIDKMNYLKSLVEGPAAAPIKRAPSDIRKLQLGERDLGAKVWKQTTNHQLSCGQLIQVASGRFFQ